MVSWAEGGDDARRLLGRAGPGLATTGTAVAGDLSMEVARGDEVDVCGLVALLRHGPAVGVRARVGMRVRAGVQLTCSKTAWPSVYDAISICATIDSYLSYSTPFEPSTAARAIMGRI